MMNNLLLDGAAANPLGGPVGMILYVVALGAMFYFLLIRPNKKRQKQEEELRSSIAVGDIVVMTSGITGKIIAIKDDEITIENGLSRTQLTFVRGAVSTVKTKSENSDSIAANVDDRKADLQKQLDERNASKKAAREAEKQAAKAAKDDKVDLF